MSAFQTKIRLLIDKIKVIPYGFKRVYQEGKEVARILHQSDGAKRGGKHYSRRENELVRQHFASIRKLGIFFLVQLPPIIGYIPMFLALKYPRQILTYHFYDNDPPMLQRFLQEEFGDRNCYAVQLVCYYPKPSMGIRSETSETSSGKEKTEEQTGPSSDTATAQEGVNTAYASTQTKSKSLVTLKDWHSLLNMKLLSSSSNNEENQRATASVDDLSRRDYLELLAKSNMIADSILGAVYSPSLFLRFWMSMRVKEIIQDDILLIQEGIDGLSPYELQQAVLRRGFAPNENETYLKQCLDVWLHQMLTEDDRNEILREGYLLSNYRHSKSAALMHLIAYNSTITKVY
jgi:hypothetical protein